MHVLAPFDITPVGISMSWGRGEGEGGGSCHSAVFPMPGVVFISSEKTCHMHVPCGYKVIFAKVVCSNPTMLCMFKSLRLPCLHPRLLRLPLASTSCSQPFSKHLVSPHNDKLCPASPVCPPVSKDLGSPTVPVYLKLGCLHGKRRGR